MTDAEKGIAPADAPPGWWQNYVTPFLPTLNQCAVITITACATITTGYYAHRLTRPALPICGADVPVTNARLEAVAKDLQTRLAAIEERLPALRKK